MEDNPLCQIQQTKYVQSNQNNDDTNREEKILPDNAVELVAELEYLKKLCKIILHHHQLCRFHGNGGA